MISLEKLLNETISTKETIDKSINSTENLNNIQSSEEKIEQNSIKLEQSLEEDDSTGDFEAAADEQSSNNNESSSDNDTDFGGSDEMPSFDDESGDDFDSGDSGSDDFGGEGDDEGGSASDNGTTGNNETDTSIDEIDKSAGSSLNPFTQVNQKMYLMDQMNLLYSSIASAIEKYTISYSETVELQQLRELLNIVSDERDSFIMQENPENIIKYKLYVKQYELIIKNLTNKIKEYE